MPQKAICLTIAFFVALAVLADADWLFGRALPAIPAPPHVPVAMRTIRKDGLEDQNALAREERGYVVDSAIAAALGALLFAGLALALVLLSRRISEHLRS